MKTAEDDPQIPMGIAFNITDMLRLMGSTTLCLVGKEPKGGTHPQRQLLHAAIQNKPVVDDLRKGLSSVRN